MLDGECTRYTVETDSVSQQCTYFRKDDSEGQVRYEDKTYGEYFYFYFLSMEIYVHM